jgi:hypothetical protein
MGALAWVEVLDAHGHVRTRHRIDSVPAIIGRGYGCDVLLDDPWVSPVHARLYRDLDGSFVLEDAGSENGLWSPGMDARIQTHRVTGGVILRAGRTTFRLIPADAPVAPTLAINASVPAVGPYQRTWIGPALAVAAGAVFGLGQLIGDPDKHLATEVVGDALSMVVLIAIWAGVWALVTRAVSQRARFLDHLTVASGIALVMLLVTDIAGYGAFLAPGSLTTEDIEALPGIAAMVLLLFGHLSIASSLSRSRIAAISLTVVGGLLGIGALAASSDDDSDVVSRPDFVAELKPLSARMIPTEDTTVFFGGIAKLRETVDSAAAVKE